MPLNPITVRVRREDEIPNTRVSVQPLKSPLSQVQNLKVAPIASVQSLAVKPLGQTPRVSVDTSYRPAPMPKVSFWDKANNFVKDSNQQFMGATIRGLADTSKIFANDEQDKGIDEFTNKIAPNIDYGSDAGKTFGKGQKFISDIGASAYGANRAVKLIPGITNAGKAATAARYGTEAVVSGAGYTAAQENKQPKDFATGAGIDLAIESVMRGAAPVYRAGKRLINRAEAPALNEAGSVQIKESEAEIAERVRNSNRQQNEANTAATREAALTGKLEEQRLTNPTAMQRANDYNGIGTSNPEAEVTVFRVADPGKTVGAGDYVSLTEEGARKYLQRSPNLELTTTKVKLGDLVGSGGTGNEFIIAPRPKPNNIPGLVEPEVRVSQGGTKHVKWTTEQADGTRNGVVFSTSKDGRKTVQVEHYDKNGNLTGVDNLGDYEKVAAKYGTRDPGEISLRATSGEVRGYGKDGSANWTTTGELTTNPLRTVKVVRGELGATTPVRDQLVNELKRNRADQRMLESDINRLNRKGLNIRLREERPQLDPTAFRYTTKEEIAGRQRTKNVKREGTYTMSPAYETTGKVITRQAIEGGVDPKKAIETQIADDPAGLLAVRNQITQREAKLAARKKEAADLYDQLNAVKGQRQALYEEAQAAGRAMPKMDEAQRANLDQITDTADEMVYGKSMNDALAEYAGGEKQAGEFMQFMRDMASRVDEAGGKLLSGESKLGRGAARIVQSVYGDFGKGEKMVYNRLNLRGGRSQAEEMSADIYKKGKGLEESFDKILRYADPTLDPKNPITADMLTPQELEAAEWLRSLASVYHEGNFQMGYIAEGTYAKNKGTYLTRSYADQEFPEEIMASMTEAKNSIKAQTDLAMKRTGMTEDKLEALYKNPFYAVARQARFYNVNRTVMNYSDNVVDNMPELWRNLGDAKAGTVRNGFVKLSDHQGYGRLAGMWVRRDAFEEIKGFFADNALLQHLYDFGNAYDAWKPRQFAKALLTILSPIQHAINRTYNYGVAAVNGINPITFNTNERIARRMIRNHDPLVVALHRLGVLKGDVAVNELKNIARTDFTGEGLNKAGKLFRKASDEYGLTDDGAKLAIVLTWTKRGYTLDEALRRSTRAMQDYSSVGKMWDISAKIPIFGKAFGRFTGDFLRVATNTVIDHPLRTITMLTAYNMMQDFSSRASGESEEDRATREARLGAGHLPFLGWSTEFQTPWGAVDIRRYLGPTAIGTTESSGTDAISGLKAFSPVDTRIGGKITDSRTGEERTDYRALTADPLAGPVAAVALDQDFTGGRIRDPQGFSNPGEPADTGKQLANIADHLRRSYTPPTGNDIEDTIRSATGQPTYYDSKKADPPVKDPWQQGIRAATGVKVTTYGSEEAEKSRKASTYFDAFNEAKGSLRNRDDIKQYDDYMSRQRTKEGKAIQESPSESLKNSAILWGNDNVRRAVADAYRKQGEHDPMWDLEDDQLKAFLQYQKQYAGDAARESIAADNPWIYDVLKARSEYYKNAEFKGSSIKNSQTPQYPEFEPQTEEIMNKYTTASPAEKGAMMEQYGDILSEGWTRKHEWTNAMRRAQGAPELDDYPQADSQTKNNIDFYYSLPKGTGARSNWIKANGDAYSKMQQYWAAQAIWQLQKEASASQYKNLDITQEFLKSAYNLGQYNIIKNADGSFTLGSSSGGGFSGYGPYKNRFGNSYKEPDVSMRVSTRSAPVGKVTIKKPPKKKYKIKASTTVPKGPTKLT